MTIEEIKQLHTTLTVLLGFRCRPYTIGKFHIYMNGNLEVCVEQDSADVYRNGRFIDHFWRFNKLLDFIQKVES